MAAPDVLDKETTDLEVVNTTTETVIFTHSVPANTMGATGILHLQIIGDYLNNNATGDTLTLKIKFGGTIQYQDLFSVAAISASRRPVVLEFKLANQDATNDQSGGGTVIIGTAGGATTGIGDLDTEAVDGMTPIVMADGIIDTTLAQVLEATVQWSVANANLSFRRRLALLYGDGLTVAAATSWDPVMWWGLG